MDKNCPTDISWFAANLPILRLPQLERELLPLLLEGDHVLLAEHALQRIEAGPVAPHIRHKLAIELR